MDRLRAADEHTRADRLALEAATGHPATAVGMLAIFRAASRDADAEAFLRLIASTDAQIYGALVHELEVSGAVSETHRLTGLVQGRSNAELAVAAVAFDRSAMARRGPGGADGFADNPLVALLAGRAIDGLVAELVLARGEHRDDEAAVLVAALGRRPSRSLGEVAAILARQSLRADAGHLLIHAARHAEPAGLAQLFRRLAQSWGRAADLIAPILAGRDDVTTFLAALEAVAPEAYPGILAERLSRADVVELFRTLTSRADHADHALVDDLLSWCVLHDDPLALATMLHEKGLHAVAYRLAERRFGG
jgi:hypothetical protein